MTRLWFSRMHVYSVGAHFVSSKWKNFCLKYRQGNQNNCWHLIPTNAGISCSLATVNFSRETSLCIIKITCVNLGLHPLCYGNDLSEESWLLHKTEKSRSHKLGSHWTSDCAKTKTSHTRFNSLKLRRDIMIAHDVNCRRGGGGGSAKQVVWPGRFRMSVERPGYSGWGFS
jgi:hypothetical protein